LNEMKANIDGIFSANVDFRLDKIISPKSCSALSLPTSVSYHSFRTS